MNRAVIVLPTYNEAGNIAKVIKAIFSLKGKLKNWKLAILVVDDFSPDKTADIVEKLQTQYPALYLIQGKKQGLGQAYVRGFAYASNKLEANIIFEMDADLSHPVNLIPKMLDKIDRGADFVIGARYIKGGGIPKDWGLHRKIYSVLGNLILTLGFMNFKVRDWTSGYRAIKVSFINQVLGEMGQYSGYVFQIALLDRAIKHNLQIANIPLKFKEREKGVSKIEALDFIINIFGYMFLNSSFLRYVWVGLTGFFIDFSITWLGVEKLGAAVWLATLLSATTAVISNFILNNLWSFSHKKIAGANRLLNSFGKFALVSVGSIAIQTLSLELLTNFLGQQYLYLLKVVVIALIIIPYSYFMYNNFVWKK
jgi:dolichol-phosphate mannosyltransferase